MSEFTFIQRVQTDTTPTLREDFDRSQSFLLYERVGKDIDRELDYVLDVLNQDPARVDRDLLADAVAGILDAVESVITDDFQRDDERAELTELLDTPVGAALFAYQGVRV